jgi:biopolymer transport protein TolQ
LHNPVYPATWILQGGADLIALVQSTGPLDQTVFAILLVVSIASWGVIISKALLFKKIRKESDTFWRIFKKANNLSEVGTAAETLRFTPLVPVFDLGCELVGVPSGGQARDSSDAIRRVVNSRTVERTIQRAASGQLSELENRMTFLATTAAVAPFIGLFGTVLGVIGSFVGLSTVGAGGTSLSSVGPGIAVALIATALGLFAAIPAVVAYNHFVTELRHVGGQLDDLQAEFMAIAEENE